jgi:uncharacterized protein YaeQ
MALKSTIYKADLQISDMDRHYYQNHTLTLALHPSETIERMMIRLMAFSLHASDNLEFGKGLSTEEDPALWQKDLTDQINLWIDVGLPDEKRIRKASHKAGQVHIYCYGERTAPIWWEQNQKKFRTFDNVQVDRVSPETCTGLTALCERTMQLHCNVMDGQVSLGNDKHSVVVRLERLL